MAEQKQQDGRRLRSVNSRRRIVEALVQLVRDGDPAPSADAVAEAAGVGRRTVFRLFTDMDSIHLEMLALTRERVLSLRTKPLAGQSTPEQLHALIERRVQVFEEVMPLIAATRKQRSRSAELRDSHREMQQGLRAILFALLPDGFGDAGWREAVDACLSLDMWLRLRREQRLDPDSAAAILHRLVDGLLLQRVAANADNPAQNKERDV